MFRSLPQFMVVDRSAPPPARDPTAFYHHPWMEPSPAWEMEVQSAASSEAKGLEEQMLRAGILASLKDAPEEGPDTKVELQKSSVSSLRLVQLIECVFEQICFSLNASVFQSCYLHGHICFCFLAGFSSWRRWVFPQKKPWWH